jgi:hypothetical protein
MPDTPLPYLNAALICEKVLLEQDGSVSVIRIADKVQMQVPSGLPPEANPPVNLNCLISIKSGPVTGDHKVSILMITPSGSDRGKSIEQPVKLLGKDQGQNFIFPFILGVNEEGLYWLVVLFDDIELTRVPLMVVRTLLPAEQGKKT